MTSEAGIEWGLGTEGNCDMNETDGGNDADDFGSSPSMTAARSVVMREEAGPSGP